MIAHEVVPRLVELLGPPRDLDSLWFGIVPEEAYDDLNEIHMTPIDVDRDALTGASIGNDVRWDNTFVHELTHAFLFGDYDGPPYWIEEGMAEAARYFVADALEKAGSTRRMMDPRFPMHMALVDAYNRGRHFPERRRRRISDPRERRGGLPWDGCGDHHPVSCGDRRGARSPHPMRRFARRSLRDERQRQLSMAHAADSVWNSPIDGL